MPYVVMAWKLIGIIGLRAIGFLGQPRAGVRDWSLEGKAGKQGKFGPVARFFGLGGIPQDENE